MSEPKKPAGQPVMSKEEFGKYNAKRLLLLEKVKRLTASDLTWVKVALMAPMKKPATTLAETGKALANLASSLVNVIEVCAPVRADGMFVPVTADEQWALAQKWSALPLTRSIADQYFKQNTYISPAPQGHRLGDFEMYSEYLNRFAYHAGNKVGAHKLWVLSKHGRTSPKPGAHAVNYGFYVDTTLTQKQVNEKASTAGSVPLIGKGLGAMVQKEGQRQLSLKSQVTKFPHRNGHLLEGFSIAQQLGAAHDVHHWDYSQLLQVMRGGSLTYQSKSYTLVEAIDQGLPLVWDEAGDLDPAEIVPAAPPPPVIAPLPGMAGAFGNLAIQSFLNAQKKK